MFRYIARILKTGGSISRGARHVARILCRKRLVGNGLSGTQTVNILSLTRSVIYNGQWVNYGLGLGAMLFVVVHCTRATYILWYVVQHVVVVQKQKQEEHRENYKIQGSGPYKDDLVIFGYGSGGAPDVLG